MGSRSPEGKLKVLAPDVFHSENKYQVSRVNARLQDFQITIDAHENGIRNLRQTIESKCERGEVARLSDLVSALQRKIEDLERALLRKTDSNTFTERIEAIEAQLAKKVESHKVEERIRAIKGEMVSEVATKVGRAEVVSMLGHKADVSEVKSLVEQASQGNNTTRLQLESALLAESEVRKDDLAAQRRWLQDETSRLKAGIGEHIQAHLGGVRGDLEEYFRDHLRAILDSEGTLIHLQENMERKIVETKMALENAVTAEMSARKQLDEALRAQIQAKAAECGDRLLEEAKHWGENLRTQGHDLRGEVQQLGGELGSLAESLTSRLDHEELARRITHYPAIVQLKADVQSKASSVELMTAMEGKVDRVQLNDAVSEERRGWKEGIGEVAAAIQAEVDARQHANEELVTTLDRERRELEREKERGDRIQAQVQEASAKVLSVAHTLQLQQETQESLSAQARREVGEGREEMRSLGAGLREDMRGLEDRVRKDLDLVVSQASGVMEKEQAARASKMKADFQEDLTSWRATLENRIQQVQSQCLEGLEEERRVREHGIDSQVPFQLGELRGELEGRVEKERQSREEGVRVLQADLTRAREESEWAVQSKTEVLNGKLAWCVEQLQAFVEEDVGKQAKALKKLKSELEDRLKGEARATGELLEKLQEDLETRCLTPLTALADTVTQLKMGLSAEERGREGAEREAQRQVELMEARIRALEPAAGGQAAFEVAMTAEMEGLRSDLRSEAAERREQVAQLGHDLAVDMEQRFDRDLQHQHQRLMQTSTELHSEMRSSLETTEMRLQVLIQTANNAMEKTEQKIQTVIDSSAGTKAELEENSKLLQSKIEAEKTSRVEEMKKMEREQRMQLLDMMAKLSAVVQEEEQEEKNVARRSRAPREVRKSSPHHPPPMPVHFPPDARIDDVIATSDHHGADLLHQSAAYASGYAAGFGWND